MNTLIIGNFISLIGCTLMVAGGFIKEKQRILTVQCFQFAFQGIANFILGAYAGFISGAVSIVRNLVVSKIGFSSSLKFLFIVIQVVISMAASGLKLVELLPIVAAIIITWYIDSKDETVCVGRVFRHDGRWRSARFYLRWYGALAARRGLSGRCKNGKSVS
jgi:hypothetical protein